MMGVLPWRRGGLRPGGRRLYLAVLTMACLALDPWAGAGAAVVSGPTAGDRWIVDPLSPPRGATEVDGETFRVVIPPGPDRRQPASILAGFGLEGDFSVSLRYRVREMPRPATGWTNLEIFVAGRDGFASVIRTNHSVLGPGYTLWFEPPKGSDRRGSWRQISTVDPSGSLHLARNGRRLSFSGGFDGGPGSAIGEVDFGLGPIDRLEIRVSVPETSKVVDVEISSPSVAADRFIYPPSPAPSLFGPRATPRLAAFLSVTAFLGWLLTRLGVPVRARLDALRP